MTDSFEGWTTNVELNIGTGKNWKTFFWQVVKNSDVSCYPLQSSSSSVCNTINEKIF